MNAEHTDAHASETNPTRVTPPQLDQQDEIRDIAVVPADEVIGSACIHLMSAAAVKCGLAEDENAADYIDLDEARKLIHALGGLVMSATSVLDDSHARPLREGLRTLQLAFREASPYPDEPGEGPGEQFTGPVYG
ncbi:MAG TPA: DUF1844 domain-containing protein [Beutenbergiaceae bacterium]|nr:DUF1844 domain-containing protein [Beutenbergiaceae bacterium]